MTSKELAEKIIERLDADEMRVSLDPLRAFIVSLLSAAISDAFKEGIEVSEHNEIAHIKEAKADAYEDAAKIAKPWPCYHNLGACGPSIAAEILRRAEAMK